MLLTLFLLFALSLALAPPQQPLLGLSRSTTVPHRYRAVPGYFIQTDKDSDDEKFDILNGFGLKKGVTWSLLESHIDQLNANALATAAKHGHCHKKSYKLFFLARHGEGYHNVAPDIYGPWDWTCQWQMKDGNGTITWYDAELTAEGYHQTDQLAGVWKKQVSDNGLSVPQSFYVSPLRRTLETFERTWNDIIDIKTTQPVVKELLRETYGIGTESKRHSKDYIEENFPFVAFEEGFSVEDEWWVPDLHESLEHRDYRSRLFLNDVFVNDESLVISVTSHLGLIKSILKTVGHRSWKLKTGQMVPVLVEASHYGRPKKPHLKEPWRNLDVCKLDPRTVVFAKVKGDDE